MSTAENVLARLRSNGIQVPADARVKLLRPRREDSGAWRWRLEVPTPSGGWGPAEPALGSMATLSECAKAWHLRVVAHAGTITVYPESQLETIPLVSRYDLRGNEPRFVTWRGEWCLLGPDWTLPIDQIVVVKRHSDGEDSAALVGGYIAERTVNRRRANVTGPTRVRYVIARIARDAK